MMPPAMSNNYQARENTIQVSVYFNSAIKKPSYKHNLKENFVSLFSVV